MIQESTLEVKVAAHGERINGMEKRLCSAEESIKEQSRILVVIERLTNGIDGLNCKVNEIGAKVDNFGKRLSTVELKPAQKWEKIAFEILKFVAIGILGYAAAKLTGGI